MATFTASSNRLHTGRPAIADTEFCPERECGSECYGVGACATNLSAVPFVQ